MSLVEVFPQSPEQPDAPLSPSKDSGDPASKKNIVVLKNRSEGGFGPEQTIYLVGTFHLSKNSCEDVRQLIQAVKPQVVMVELCEERKSMLNAIDPKAEKLGTRQHLQLWREGRQPMMAVVYAWMLERLADDLGVNAGEEFRVAVEEATKINAKICLGDRNVSITVARSWDALGSLWQKTRFICSLLWTGLTATAAELEEVMGNTSENEDAVTEMIKDLSKSHPKLLRPLLEERDEYMVWLLRQLAKDNQTVVGVVGAGHLKGMQQRWETDIDNDAVREILRMPESRRSSRSWTQVILVATAGSAAVATLVYAWQWSKLK